MTACQFMHTIEKNWDGACGQFCFSGPSFVSVQIWHVEGDVLAGAL
jgi:hypothetical protein